MFGLSAWPYIPYKFLWGGLDLLCAPTCAGCDEPGTRWCKNCQNDLLPIPEPLYDICGSPHKKHGIRQTCLISRPPYKSLRSWTVFKGPIRNAIHHLKYRRDLASGDALSNHVLHDIRIIAWPIDLAVPTPLSGQRHKERGYNQSALVAYPFSLQM